MLALADKDGIVHASIPGLGDMARVSTDHAEAALSLLEGPDKYSRTKDHDGRRIEVIDGGWRILNHTKYRETLKNEKSPSSGIKHGRIYFIEASGLIKIGFSQNPWARYAALRKTTKVANPTLLGHYAGTTMEEAELHIRFKTSRKGDGWYEKTSELLEVVATILNSSATVAKKVAIPRTTFPVVELQYAEAEAEAEIGTVKRPTVGEAASYATSSPTIISPECVETWHDDRSRMKWCILKQGTMVSIGTDWQADLRIFARNWKSIRDERAAKNGTSSPSSPPPSPTKRPAEPSNWRELYEIETGTPPPKALRWDYVCDGEKEISRAILARANSGERKAS